MQGYDNWLWNQASYLDDYWYDFCPDSEPKLINDDYYNCTVCDNSDCEYWAEYNGYKLYDETGCQLGPDAANAVYDYIQKTDIFDEVKGDD